MHRSLPGAFLDIKTLPAVNLKRTAGLCQDHQRHQRGEQDQRDRHSQKPNHHGSILKILVG